MGVVCSFAITCKLYDIEYNNNNHHLGLSLTDNELELTDKLIRNYNSIINKPQYKLTESDENINNNNNMNKKSMNDVIIADSKQYHFITNALNPTSTAPPISMEK